jgi:hypothetical protein
VPVTEGTTGVGLALDGGKGVVGLPAATIVCCGLGRSSAHDACCAWRGMQQTSLLLGCTVRAAITAPGLRVVPSGTRCALYAHVLAGIGKRRMKKGIYEPFVGKTCNRDRRR